MRAPGCVAGVLRPLGPPREVSTCFVPELQTVKSCSQGLFNHGPGYQLVPTGVQGPFSGVQERLFLHWVGGETA